MKTIIRTEIESRDLENYLNNLTELYEIVHISHSTYVVDIRTYHSVVALVCGEKRSEPMPFEVAMAIQHYATCKHRWNEQD